MRSSLRLSGLLALVCVIASWQGACGGDDASIFPNGPDGGGGGDDATTQPPGSFPEGGVIGTGDAAVGQITITPADPTVDVNIVDGVVTSTPVSFVATSQGSPVAASWSLDRGELGSIVAASGVFTASGNVPGTAKVTARYQAVLASTTVTVRIKSVQNGKPTGTGADAGAGGNGGVGGSGLGGPVDNATMARLRGTATAPANPQELGFLYPYDRTVWPRGLLAPLLQWQTTHAATAIYIHLTEKGYEFEGFYSGTSLVNSPIVQAAWDQATYGNTGDDLKVEVKIADATNVWGPIAETYPIAPGVLKGTVYYNSYHTALAVPVQNETRAAAILAIKPGASDPTLAIPGTQTKCVVCHTVSDDGSTLFAQNGKVLLNGNKITDDYSEGESYDLENNGAVIASYTGNAPDGTTNNRKFLWSGVSADGTYSMQSAGHTQEAFPSNSRVFQRDNGNAVASTGFDGVVKEAVTPAFSRDMKHVAFNYWTAVTGTAGGGGHTLDVMDFACGAVPGGDAGAGSPTCSSYAFTNLRRLYTNTDAANGFVGWPAWLPDGSGVVFHNVVTKPTSGSPLATWKDAKAELWWVDVPPAGGAAPQPRRLDALDGRDASGNSYLPTNADHPDDTVMNYEPTVNPIASGGYYWVVFTSRRMYGNVASGDGYDVGNGTYPVPKKLWVAAIDLKTTPGKDPSHPAFYLPGQEINAPNMRGFWVVDPCHPNGTSCTTGDECCNGFCRQPDDGGALQCTDKPQGCAQEFEKCTVDLDCCGAGSAGYTCLNGRCARPTPK